MDLQAHSGRQLLILSGLFLLPMVVLPLLAVFGVISWAAALAWSGLALIPLLASQSLFWLSRPGRALAPRLGPVAMWSSMAGVAAVILLFMLRVSGMEVHEKLILKHPANPRVGLELRQIFFSYLDAETARKTPGSLVEFVSTTEGTEVLLHTRSGFWLDNIKSLLARIMELRDRQEPTAQFVILAGDDPRMYEYSQLKAGDVIPAVFDWQKRRLESSGNTQSMLGLGDCSISLPLRIDDRRIFVSPTRDKQLTREKLGVSYEQLSEQERADAESLFMVAHKIEFSDRQTPLLEKMQYDGAGGMLLNANELGQDTTLSRDCDNRNGAMYELAMKHKDPQLMRLMFPALSMDLQGWRDDRSSEFVGFAEMFRRFPWELQLFF